MRAPITVVVCFDELEGPSLEKLTSTAMQGSQNGRRVVGLVDVTTPRDVNVPGVELFRLLDGSLNETSAWAKRSRRDLALDRHSIVADRLRLLVDLLKLRFDDQIVLLAANMMQMDALWPFLLTTPSSRPSIVVDLVELIASPSAGDDVDAFANVDLAGLLQLTKRRLAALGLDVSDRFIVRLEEPLASDDGVRRDAPFVVTSSLPAVLEQSIGAVDVPTEQQFVVHIAPNWGGMGCSHVFEAQLRMLESLGMAVLALHVDVNDLARLAPDQFDALMGQVPSNGAAHRWVLKRSGDAVIEAQHGLLPPHQRPFLSFEGESRIARQAVVSDTLRDALAERSISWVLCNYGHLMPLVQRLGLAHRPVVCETHDVRAEQHRLQNGHDEIDATDLELERAAWSSADGVVFINAAEREAYAALDPANETVSAFPLFVLQGEGAKALHGSPSTSILQAVSTGGLAVDVALDAAARTVEPQDDGRSFALFVGSDHEANVESLDWYLEKVHLAGLESDGVELLVVGNIEHVYRSSPVPGVHFFGRVEDLDPFYEVADVVVLPIVSGTGMPIKTIDVVARDLPFVATSQAVEALPELASSVETTNDPVRFAELVKERLRSGKLATVGFETDGWERYRSVWVDLLQSIGVPTDDRTIAVQNEIATASMPGEISVDGVVTLDALEVCAGAELGDTAVTFREPYCRLAVPAGSQTQKLVLDFQTTGDAQVLDVIVDGFPIGRTTLRPETDSIVTILPDDAGGAGDHGGWRIVELVWSDQASGLAVSPRGASLRGVSWK